MKTNAGSAPPPTPRWVKVLGIITLLLVLLLAILLLAGPGNHGPRRHVPPGDPDGQTPPIEHVLQQT